MPQVDRVRFIVLAGIAKTRILAAQAEGCFGREGLAVARQQPPFSQAQRAALLEGTAGITHSAFADAVVPDARARTPSRPIPYSALRNLG